MNFSVGVWGCEWNSINFNGTRNNSIVLKFNKSDIERHSRKTIRRHMPLSPQFHLSQKIKLKRKHLIVSNREFYSISVFWDNIEIFTLKLCERNNMPQSTFHKHVFKIKIYFYFSFLYPIIIFPTEKYVSFIFCRKKCKNGIWTIAF